MDHVADAVLSFVSSVAVSSLSGMTINPRSHPSKCCILLNSSKARIASKIDTEYKDLTTLPVAVAAQQGGAGPARPGAGAAGPAAPPAQVGTKRKLIEGAQEDCVHKAFIQPCVATCIFLFC